MGRTNRKRRRKHSFSLITSLETNPTVIALKQWMKNQNWPSSKHLRLANFENTGRGFLSKRKIKKFDVLLSVPYASMITYSSIEKTEFLKLISCNTTRKLTIHDILSLYLVFEKHKNHKSNWKIYIDSLPVEPPAFPWLCSQDEIEKLPEEIKFPVEKQGLDFRASWERVEKSLNPDWKCPCCEIQGMQLLNHKSYTWAYAMVNTRAVYVDPTNIPYCSKDILSDPPSMALCPYLDMFNHSSLAQTEANLENDGQNLTFNLRTLTEYKKHEQIFISYGSHDNLKLLCEYGFFLPQNIYDTVRFRLQEILSHNKFSVDEKQYKFIRERRLHHDLYLNAQGLSYNLKAVFFVIFTNDIKTWCEIIYSDNYSNSVLRNMYVATERLLQKHLEENDKIVDALSSNSVNKTQNFKLVIEYLRYRSKFICELLDVVEKEINK